MDGKRRFIVVKDGSIPTAGSEGGSGTGSLILLLVASLIGVVVAATSLIIGTPGSLGAASPAVATSEPKSPPAKTFHEQYPVQASETTIDPPTF